MKKHRKRNALESTSQQPKGAGGSINRQTETMRIIERIEHSTGIVVHQTEGFVAEACKRKFESKIRRAVEKEVESAVLTGITEVLRLMIPTMGFEPLEEIHPADGRLCYKCEHDHDEDFDKSYFPFVQRHLERIIAIKQRLGISEEALRESSDKRINQTTNERLFERMKHHCRFSDETILWYAAAALHAHLKWVERNSKKRSRSKSPSY